MSPVYSLCLRSGERVRGEGRVRTIRMMGAPFQLLLADLSAPLVAAWEREFAGEADVSVEQGDLIALATNTIVSPANSMGIMDGGFDEVLVRRFGTSLEGKVMQAVAQRGGELPVGTAAFIE